MDTEQYNDPEMTALVAALRGLKPTDSRVDREQLLFDAGRASVQGAPVHGASARAYRRWAWPVTTVVSLVIAVAAVLNPQVEMVVAPDLAETTESDAERHKTAAPETITREAPQYLLERRNALAGRFENRFNTTSETSPSVGSSSRGQIVKELLQDTLL